MADLWLGDFGIRVTDFERSIGFYTKLLDLQELVRSESDDSKYVLFRDRHSGQRLELNWYAESSPFWVPYVPGEGLDHIEVRVRSLPELVGKLKEMGIPLATRKLFKNAEAVRELRRDPRGAEWLEQDVWETESGHRIAYIQDPDGNYLCLYDHPEEEWAGPLPDHY